MSLMWDMDQPFILKETFNIIFLIQGHASPHKKFLRHLSRRSVTRLKAIFLSHTHRDHVGALNDILLQIPTDVVYWNELLPPEEETVVRLDEAQTLAKFVRLTPGTEMPLTRKSSLRVLANSLKTNNLNDNSLVFGLMHRKRKILLTGDAGLARQKDLAQLEPKWLKKTNLLIWPHHGDTLDPIFMKTLKKLIFVLFPSEPIPMGCRLTP